jgi:ferredoxin
MAHKARPAKKAGLLIRPGRPLCMAHSQSVLIHARSLQAVKGFGVACTGVLLCVPGCRACATHIKGGYSELKHYVLLMLMTTHTVHVICAHCLRL